MTYEGRITSGDGEGGRKSYDLPLFTFGAVCHGSHKFQLFFLRQPHCLIVCQGLGWPYH